MEITIYCVGTERVATELFLALIGEYGHYFYIRNNAITTDDAFVVQNAIAFCRGYMEGRK